MPQKNCKTIKGIIRGFAPHPLGRTLCDKIAARFFRTLYRVRLPLSLNIVCFKVFDLVECQYRMDMAEREGLFGALPLTLRVALCAIKSLRDFSEPSVGVDSLFL